MSDQYLIQLSQERSYPYNITRSARAKYTRIKISNCGILTLIIPVHTSIKYGQSFIQSKVVWIEKQLGNSVYTSDDLPEFLHLKLLKETWDISYQESKSKKIYLTEESGFKLIIRGAISNKELIKKVINQWCQFKSKHIFHEMLQEIAIEYNFHFKKLSIRSQKTRWGSCSQDKNISLNSKLLFLDKKIVRYVMIHELCHTKEMNHSQRFWRLVNDCDPNYLEHRKQLKKFGSLIPL